MRRLHRLPRPSFDGRTPGRKRRELALIFALIFGLCSSSAEAKRVPFSARQTITASADGARSVFAADIDGDGDLDAISASFIDDTIAWHENDGGDASSWISHTITTAADVAYAVFAADVDGDGDLDVLAASQNDDTIAWHENASANGDGTVWMAHTISTLGDTPRSVHAADVDGDGDIDVLSTSTGDNEVTWHENDNGDGSAWTSQVVTSSSSFPYSVTTGDVDGDGDLDVLTASTADNTIAWHENTAGDGSAWTPHPISTTTLQARSVVAADVDGDGDLDALSAAIQNDEIAWHENTNGDGTAWTTHSIATTADSARTVYASDVDGDGDVDALSASPNDDEVAWYENLAGDGSLWATRTLTTLADQVRTVFAADLDGDGDTDVLAASKEDDTIGWFENNAIHRSALFPDASSISSSAGGPRAAVPADIDGDGDLDLVVGGSFNDELEWYENLGGGGTWTPTTITTNVDLLGSVVAADLDQDGDLDIAACFFDATGTEVNEDRLAWYENASPSGDGSSWIEHAPGPPGLPLGGRVLVAVDLDSDGDLDLAFASTADQAVHWLENDASDGSTWTQRLVGQHSMFLAASGLAAADVDRDGDLDLLSAGNSQFVWLENSGGGGSWSQHSHPAPGIRSLFAADLDGDGDHDLLVPASSNLSWYENTDGAGNFGARQMITTQVEQARIAWAADLDGDGDLDALSASGLDDKVAWYENLDGAGTFGPQQVISTTTDVPTALATADLDRDGDLDVVTAALFDDRVEWYQNRGGQFALPTVSHAQSVLALTQYDTLFLVDLFHRGRSGDSEVELATIELLFDDGTGTPLSSAQANDLFMQLNLYLDNGDREVGVGDLLMEQISAFSLVDGVQTLDIPIGTLAGQVAPESSRLYLVEIVIGGSGTFQVTHLTESSSSARDASASAVGLDLEHQVNVATGPIDTQIDDGDGCTAPYAMDLFTFSVFGTVVCEAGTVLRASGSFTVQATGDLTLRAGQSVVLGPGFSVKAGGGLAVAVDPSLIP